MVKYMVWLAKFQEERGETNTDEALMRESEDVGGKEPTCVDHMH